MLGPFEHGGFALNYQISTAIPKYRIVAFDAAADKTVMLADSSTARLIGVSSDIDSDPTDPNEHCDVWRCGLHRVVYGAAVQKGTFVTSDADGKAIPASTGDRVLGIAEIDGNTDDIGSVDIQISARF